MVSVDNDDRDQSLDINRIASESCDASYMRITRQIYVWRTRSCYSAMAREMQSSRHFIITRP
jgi:hypothetical protein